MHVTVADVRERFAGLPTPDPVDGSGLRPAAVLLPVFEEDGAARLVLTRRPEWMPSHQGEIAFPGGKVDPAVDRDARDAALREAEEEIGLPRDAVEVIAELPTMATVVGTFMISPFVGILDGRPHLTPDPREVDRVFDVALADLLVDVVYREERWPLAGAAGVDHPVAFFELPDETVWGATARILMGFLAHLVDAPIDPGWYFG